MALSNILESYRAAFPGDDRSDDVLVKFLGDLGRQRGDTALETDPEFGERYNAINALTQPSALENAARSYGRSALSTLVAAPLKEISIAGTALARATGTTSEGLIGQSADPTKQGLYRLGEAVEGAIEPPGENARGSFLQTTLPAAAGSMTGLLAGGVAGKLAKIPSAVAVGALGGAAQGVQGFEEARAAGAPEDDQIKSFLLNNIVGGSEIVPVAGFLSRANRVTGGAFGRALAQVGIKSPAVVGGIKGGVEEALQETFQQTASNFIAQGIYDPKRQLLAGVGEGAGAGGILGFAVGALAGAIGAKLRPSEELETYTGKVSDERLTKAAENAYQEIVTGVQQSHATPKDAALHNVVKERIEDAIAERDQQESDQQQRLGADPLVQTEGQDRIIPPEVQTPGDAPGGRDLVAEGGQVAEAVAPIPVVESEPAPVPVAAEPVPEPVAPDPRTEARRAAAEALVPAIPQHVPKTAQDVAKPVPDVAEVSTTDVPLQKQVGGIKGPGGKEIAVSSAFFEIGDPTYTPALERSLVSQSATKDPNARKTLTHRVTFFEDQETAEVVGLPTYRTATGVRVSGLPDGTPGTTLSKFMESGRYVPIGSKRTDKVWDASDKADRVRYEDAREFERVEKQAAIQQVSAARRTEEAAEAAMTQETAGGEEVSGQEQFSEEELSDQFYEIVTDFMPKVGGELAPGLNLADIESVLANAHETTEAREAIRYQFKAAMEDAIKYDALRGLTPEGIKLKVLRAVANRVYEVYQETVATAKAPSVFAEALRSEIERGPEYFGSAPGQGTEGIVGPGAKLRVGPDTYTSTSDSAGKFHSALSALSVTGIDVQVLQARTDKLAEDLLSRPGSGSFESGKNLVNVVVSDIHRPNREDAVALLHETVHYLYANESQAMQDRLHRAIDSMAAGNQLASEEYLAEQVAQAGVDQQEAVGIAATIWRFLKSLYQRALMALQESFLGPGHVRPELAQAYLENRLAQFLARDSEVFSFLSILGGPKPNTASEAKWFTPTEGGGWFNEFYNMEDGELQYPIPLPEDSASVRWRKGERLNDPVGTYYKELTPAVATVDVAAQNFIGDTVREMVKEWTARGHNPTGMTYDDVVAQKVITLPGAAQGVLVKLAEPPETVIATINDELAVNNHPAANPAERFATLPNAEAVKISAAKTYPILNKLRGWLGRQRMEADTELSKTSKNSLQNRLAHSRTRLNDVVIRSHDKNFLLTDMKQEIDEMLNGLKEDIRLLNSSARQKGILSQVIAQIDQDQSARTPSKYAGVINKLATRLAEEPVKFTAMMDRLVDLGLNWRAHGNTLRAQILNDISTTDPLFESLLPDTDATNAMVSILVAYGKKNASVMAMRQIERAHLGNDLVTLRNSLKLAVSDVTGGINEARKIAQKLPKVATAVERLLVEVEAEKANQRKLLLEIQTLEGFVEWHNDTRKVLNDRMIELEKILGAQTRLFEANHGDVYHDVPRPNATEEEVLATTKTLDLQNATKGTTSIRETVARLEAWLNNVPVDQRGSTWNNLKMEAQKLGKLDVEFQHPLMARNVVSRLIGSWSDKMNLTGEYLLRKAAKRWIQWETDRSANREDADLKGIRVDLAKGDAMKAVDPKMSRELFDTYFYDAAMKYLATRVDLFLGTRTEEDGMRKALPALRKFLEGNPDTRDALARNGVWSALEKFYIQNAVASDYFNGLARRLGNKVKQEIGSDESIYRDTVGYSWTHVARSPKLQRLFQLMRPAWAGTDTKIEPTTKEQVAADYAADPAKLRADLAPRFTPEVWREFVEELARRPTSPFYGSWDGTFEDIKALATHNDTVKAFESTRPGDVVGFAENLFALSGGKGDQALFVGETLDTFQKFYNDIHGDEAQSANGQDSGRAVPRHLMLDNRKADTYPAAWVSYLSFGRQQSQYILRDITQTAAFGRDLKGMTKDIDDGVASLKLKATALEKIDQEVRRRNPGAKEGRIQDLIKAEAERLGGKNYHSVLKNAAKNLTLAEQMSKQFDAMIKSQNEMPLELRAWSEILSGMTSFTVTGPKTSLTDTVTLYEGTLRRTGVSTLAIKEAINNTQSFAVQVFGAMFNAMHLQWLSNAEYVRQRVDAGYYDSRGGLTIRQQVQAEFMRPSDAKILRPAVMASRAVRGFLQSGLSGGQERSPFAVFNPLSPFIMGSKAAHFAWIETNARTYSELIDKGVQRWLNPAYASELHDPNFILQAKHLGYKKRFFIFDDERAFMMLREAMQQQGLNLETVIRDVIKRRTVDPRAPTLTKESYQALAAMISNQITLDSNAVNRPISSYTNPVTSAAMPLLGWSFSKFNDLPKAMREPNGEASWAAFRAGLKVFAAMLPIGLAYAFMRDEYDEKVIGKKSNVLGLDQGNVVMAMIDRSANVGLWGIGGDLVNSLVNFQTQRPFTVDSRVFAVSSTLSMLSAASTWARQGDATYSTVYRPMFMAVGGSGFLQYVQAINNALSLDNEEARVTARINVANYLRAAGRTLQMDVRSSRVAGFGDLPSPVRPYISQMALAAYANDLGDFHKAREQAIEVAEAAGKEDPAEFVSRSFAALHPLKTVFRTSPSLSDYSSLLSVLDSRGRSNVEEAIRLFNEYGSLIGIKEFEGKAEKKASPFKLPSVADFRRSLGLSLTR